MFNMFILVNKIKGQGDIVTEGADVSEITLLETRHWPSSPFWKKKEIEN